MEKRIYEVAYEVKLAGEDWFTDHDTVLANGDAMTAVEKAKRAALKHYAKPFKDEDGQTVTPKVQSWRLNAVRVVAEADIV